jgi:hypothetical protein
MYVVRRYDLKVCDDGTIVYVFGHYPLSCLYSKYRPVSIVSPCYADAEFPHKILSPLAGNAGSFVKNSEHFIELIKYISIQTENYLVKFDIFSTSGRGLTSHKKQTQYRSFPPKMLTFAS